MTEASLSQMRLRAEAAAGPQASLRLRAKSYLDLYHASNGACRFALIAAHGALWASWYLICAKLAAMVFALIDPTHLRAPSQRYRAFATYIDLLKEINQLVFIETYVLVHCLRDFGPEAAVQARIPADIAQDYARAMGGDASIELRDLYQRHFRWEQTRVVSDKLTKGFAEFDWPLMRGLCQRPWVWFSYFPTAKSLNFRNFTDSEERVEKGLIAYDRAQEVGFGRIAAISAVRLRIFPGFTQWKRSLATALGR